MRSYDYAHRKGVREISWEKFASLAAQVAEALAERRVDTIVVEIEREAIKMVDVIHKSREGQI